MIMVNKDDYWPVTVHKYSLHTVRGGAVGDVTNPAVTLTGEKPRLQRIITSDDNVVAGAM